jgi:hypothetical protein
MESAASSASESGRFAGFPLIQYDPSPALGGQAGTHLRRLTAEPALFWIRNKLDKV